jgi:hypothetical protein
MVEQEDLVFNSFLEAAFRIYFSGIFLQISLYVLSSTEKNRLRAGACLG